MLLKFGKFDISVEAEFCSYDDQEYMNEQKLYHSGSGNPMLANDRDDDTD